MKKHFITRSTITFTIITIFVFQQVSMTFDARALSVQPLTGRLSIHQENANALKTFILERIMRIQAKGVDLSEIKLSKGHFPTQILSGSRDPEGNKRIAVEKISEKSEGIYNTEFRVNDSIFFADIDLHGGEIEIQVNRPKSPGRPLYYFPAIPEDMKFFPGMLDSKVEDSSGWATHRILNGYELDKDYEKHKKILMDYAKREIWDLPNTPEDIEKTGNVADTFPEIIRKRYAKVLFAIGQMLYTSRMEDSSLKYIRRAIFCFRLAMTFERDNPEYHYMWIQALSHDYTDRERALGEAYLLRALYEEKGVNKEKINILIGYVLSVKIEGLLRLMEDISSNADLWREKYSEAEEYIKEIFDSRSHIKRTRELSLLGLTHLRRARLLRAAVVHKEFFEESSSGAKKSYEDVLRELGDAAELLDRARRLAKMPAQKRHAEGVFVTGMTEIFFALQRDLDRYIDLLSDGKNNIKYLLFIDRLLNGLEEATAVTEHGTPFRSIIDDKVENKVGSEIINGTLEPYIDAYINANIYRYIETYTDEKMNEKMRSGEWKGSESAEEIIAHIKSGIINDLNVREIVLSRIRKLPDSLIKKIVKKMEDLKEEIVDMRVDDIFAGELTEEIDLAIIAAYMNLGPEQPNSAQVREKAGEYMHIDDEAVFEDRVEYVSSIFDFSIREINSIYNENKAERKLPDDMQRLIGFGDIYTISSMLTDRDWVVRMASIRHAEKMIADGEGSFEKGGENLRHLLEDIRKRAEEDPVWFVRYAALNFITNENIRMNDPDKFRSEYDANRAFDTFFSDNDGFFTDKDRTQVRNLAKKLLQDPVYTVREYAIRVLARLEVRDLNYLLKKVLDDDPSEVVCKTAINILAELSPKNIMELKEDLINEEKGFGSRLEMIGKVYPNITGWQDQYDVQLKGTEGFEGEKDKIEGMVDDYNKRVGGINGNIAKKDRIELTRFSLKIEHRLSCVEKRMAGMEKAIVERIGDKIAEVKSDIERVKKDAKEFDIPEKWFSSFLISLDVIVYEINELDKWNIDTEQGQVVPDYLSIDIFSRLYSEAENNMSQIESALLSLLDYRDTIQMVDKGQEAIKNIHKLLGADDMLGEYAVILQRLENVILKQAHKGLEIEKLDKDILDLRATIPGRTEFLMLIEVLIRDVKEIADGLAISGDYGQVDDDNIEEVKDGIKETIKKNIKKGLTWLGEEDISAVEGILSGKDKMDRFFVLMKEKAGMMVNLEKARLETVSLLDTLRGIKNLDMRDNFPAVSELFEGLKKRSLEVRELELLWRKNEENGKYELIDVADFNEVLKSATEEIKKAYDSLGMTFGFASHMWGVRLGIELNLFRLFMTAWLVSYGEVYEKIDKDLIVEMFEDVPHIGEALSDGIIAEDATLTLEGFEETLKESNMIKRLNMKKTSAAMEKILHIGFERYKKYYHDMDLLESVEDQGNDLEACILAVTEGNVEKLNLEVKRLAREWGFDLDKNPFGLSVSAVMDPDLLGIFEDMRLMITDVNVIKYPTEGKNTEGNTLYFVNKHDTEALMEATYEEKFYISFDTNILLKIYLESLNISAEGITTVEEFLKHLKQQAKVSEYTEEDVDELLLELVKSKEILKGELIKQHGCSEEEADEKLSGLFLADNTRVDFFKECLMRIMPDNAIPWSYVTKNRKKFKVLSKIEADLRRRRDGNNKNMDPKKTKQRNIYGLRQFMANNFVYLIEGIVQKFIKEQRSIPDWREGSKKQYIIVPEMDENDIFTGIEMHLFSEDPSSSGVISCEFDVNDIIVKAKEKAKTGDMKKMFDGSSEERIQEQFEQCLAFVVKNRNSMFRGTEKSDLKDFCIRPEYMFRLMLAILDYYKGLIKGKPEDHIINGGVLLLEDVLAKVNREEILSRYLMAGGEMDKTEKKIKMLKNKLGSTGKDIKNEDKDRYEIMVKNIQDIEEKWKRFKKLRDFNDIDQDALDRFMRPVMKLLNYYTEEVEENKDAEKTSTFTKKRGKKNTEDKTDLSDRYHSIYLDTSTLRFEAYEGEVNTETRDMIDMFNLSLARYMDYIISDIPNLLSMDKDTEKMIIELRKKDAEDRMVGNFLRDIGGYLFVRNIFEEASKQEFIKISITKEKLLDFGSDGTEEILVSERFIDFVLGNIYSGSMGDAPKILVGERIIHELSHIGVERRSLSDKEKIGLRLKEAMQIERDIVFYGTVFSERPDLAKEMENLTRTNIATPEGKKTFGRSFNSAVLFKKIQSWTKRIYSDTAEVRKEVATFVHEAFGHLYGEDECAVNDQVPDKKKGHQINLIIAQWMAGRVRDVERNVMESVENRDPAFFIKERHIVISSSLIPKYQKDMIDEINRSSKNSFESGFTRDLIEIRDFSYIQNVRSAENKDVVILLEKEESGFYTGEEVRLVFNLSERAGTAVLINGLIAAGHAVLYGEMGALRKILLLLSGGKEEDLPDMYEIEACFRNGDRKAFANMVAITLPAILVLSEELRMLNENILELLQYA